MTTLKGFVKAGLIGHPAAHSLSPTIYMRLSRSLGRKVAYKALDVPPQKLASTMRCLQEEGCVGLNVTIPHKKAVLPLLQELSPEARVIGAVNAVCFSGRRAKGHNTDASGFRDALRQAGFRIKGRLAVVFGAGGAAAAVGYALGRAGALQVSFVARRPGKARGLARRFQRFFPKTEFRAGLPAGAEIWINATPLGMKGFPNRSPAPEGMPGCGLAFDLVYGRKTPFLRQAAAGGARAVDGLGMLVFQALRSWEFWFGRMRAPRRRQMARMILEGLQGGT